MFNQAVYMHLVPLQSHLNSFSLISAWLLHLEVDVSSYSSAF